MKKTLGLFVTIIFLLGIGSVYLVKNPTSPISQKILPLLGVASIETGKQAVIDPNCISYFDGCNTCTVKNGKPSACTLMYCETPSEPKCNEYANNTPNSGSIELANPASTNCVNNGGKLEIIDTTGGQVGMCTLSDGMICEERAYYRGECGDTNLAKACTEEAKMCPDGSAVGRTGPNCEFTPCPDEEPTACTMQYDPVCASVAVQCIKAPCNPVEQTFSNECMMNTNKSAKFLYKGECTTK